MPLIDITVPAGALGDAAAKSLPDELATILLRWEGAPDTEFFREITWVYLHEIPEGGLAVGGRPGGAPRYRVDITVPEGALSQRRKDGLVADVHAAVTAAAGLDPAQALHVWTLIREVPEGNWGAAGQTIRFADLKKASEAERERTAAS
ncbi:4-oxalocrotonate tautomerase family protein [Amycolatopsis sp. NPDC059021]|uniref:tautomerase family protein n=1 Tax=Amycolatopsis sp. NPDC059021 TaxID=3346704 RepID=UPI0036714817